MTSSHSARKPYIALYGNTRILKAYCRECEAWAFVIKGLLACCDSPFTEAPVKFKREIEALDRRRLPPIAERRAQLIAQDYRCFYCERAFNSIICRGFRRVTLKLSWDHLVPYSFSRDNSAANFVAACHVCNHIKADICFETIAEAKIYIEAKRGALGYS